MSAKPPTDFFGPRVGEYPEQSAAGELMRGLANDSLTPSSRDEIENRYGLQQSVELHKLKLDWVLEYARAVLEADPLSRDLATLVAPLKVQLGIREGDFCRLRTAELKALLLEQLELVLEDGVLDDYEELSQAVLQRSFSLGYDEYLGLTRSRYEVELADIKAKLATTPPAELPVLERQLLALRSICELAVTQPRSVGGLR